MQTVQSVQSMFYRDWLQTRNFRFGFNSHLYTLL